MNFRALLAFFTLFPGFGFVLAQQNPNQGAPAIDALFRQDGFPFSIQVWDNRSGLPQNSVNDVLFLPEMGTIALATNGGLVYFNGNRFEMDQKLEAIRPLWRITSLFKDPQNRIWALGEGRIGFCDSAGWHMIPSVFPPQNLIRFFPAGTPDGSPGLLTKEGCFLVDQTGTKTYNPASHRQSLLDVKSNAAGETWFLYADALTSSTGQSYAIHAGAKAEVFPLSDGRVAVFNPDSIFIFTGKKRQKLYSPFTLGEISSVESWGEELLLATTNGLYHWKPGKDQARRWSESFLRTPLSRAQIDGSGLLWVASKTSGLALMSKKILYYPPDYEEFAFWSVNGVYYDPSAAKLFIGPDCGMISILDQDSKTILTSKSTCAYSFAPAGRSRLFVGTFGGGLQTMRSNGDSTLTVPASLFPPRYVYSIIPASNTTYFGTEDGLWQYQSGSFSKVNPRLFPPNARVFVQKWTPGAAIGWEPTAHRALLNKDNLRPSKRPSPFPMSAPCGKMAMVPCGLEPMEKASLGTAMEGLQLCLPKAFRARFLPSSL